MYDQNAQLLFREILCGNTDIPDPPSRIIKCFISSSGKTGTHSRRFSSYFFLRVLILSKVIHRLPSSQMIHLSLFSSKSLRLYLRSHFFPSRLLVALFSGTGQALIVKQSPAACQNDQNALAVRLHHRLTRMFGTETRRSSHASLGDAFSLPIFQYFNFIIFAVSPLIWQ